MKGLLIALEGIDGTGKSSVHDRLCHYVRSRNLVPIKTREPGGTPFAEKIRDLVKADRDEEVSSLTETLLFFAARSQHIVAIRKWLEEGKVVITDRFVDSTYAYQSAGGGVCYSFLETLTNEVVDKTLPDLTILLTVDIDEGLRRARERGKLDVMDSKPREYYHKAQREFLEMAEREPERYVIVDANAPFEQVCAVVIDHVQTLINTHMKKNFALNQG